MNKSIEKDIKKTVTAVIDPGGGFRGAYAAGILDFCLDHGIEFDLCIGVSAGSGNLSSYLSRQRGRNYSFYTKYSQRPEYMSFRNLFTKHSYVDLDYVYTVLPAADSEDPIDVDTLMNSHQKLVVVATNALNGEPVYFEKEDIDVGENTIFKASSAIPILFSPYFVDGIPYYDGSIADPIPMAKALEEGADKVVVILSKPADVPRTDTKDRFLASMIRKYPEVKTKLLTRIERYNTVVEEIRRLEKEGKALIIAPESTFHVTTLSRKVSNIEKLYRAGYADAEKILDFLEG